MKKTIMIKFHRTISNAAYWVFCHAFRLPKFKAAIANHASRIEHHHRNAAHRINDSK